MQCCGSPSKCVTLDKSLGKNLYQQKKVKQKLCCEIINSTDYLAQLIMWSMECENFVYYRQLSN